uniref:Uncharacterized protein n=1 Tax=Avena sativa TaxID=4498 RepID=A0ACD5WSH4_AVESA
MSDVDSTEAFRKIFSASCRPPPLPSRDAAAAAAPADWVLLEPLAYVADQRNATTAEASSSTGHTVQVTVCLTDPLGVSYVCVHCPGFKDTDYAARPSIVCSEKDFLLLSVIFLSGLSGSQGREYFVYKAGPGRPSLQLIPGPYPRVLTASGFGLLPSDDGDHFVLATLCFALTPWVYDLHMFSSRTWAWSTKVPQTEISSAVRMQVSLNIPSKVIQLGGGTLGWVDLWRGIIVCNVLDEMPVLRFITLPMLMPGNKEGTKPCPWPLRNVAYSNGLIKFIEIEKHERPDVDERSYDDMDTLYESDCLTKPKEVGWRAMTWYRMTSWDHWRKGCMAYDKEITVDCQRHSTLLPELTSSRVHHGLCKGCMAYDKEISVDCPRHSKLLPDLRDNNARDLTLKDLLASHPVLSLTCHCDDVVYMLCKPKSCNPKAWLVTVDLKKKILVELAPFSLEGYFSTAHPSELSSYLNTAPATEGTSGP